MFLSILVFAASAMCLYLGFNGLVTTIGTLIKLSAAKYEGTLNYFWPLAALTAGFILLAIATALLVIALL